MGKGKQVRIIAYIRSTDDSYIICNELASKDSRIKCFHTENRGSGPARNYGISKAKGDYLYFPDADDYLEPNAIRCMVEATNEGSCDLVVFGFKEINSKGVCVKSKTYLDSIQNALTIRENYSEYMRMDCKWGIQGAPWNKLFKRSVVSQYGIEYPSIKRHQDEGFISRYMCYAQKVHFIPNILYTYFLNDLEKEWEKYPDNYIDSVMELYEIRKQTILTWNTEDVKTHEIVEQSMVNNFIKALELSYSPKMSLSRKERYIWIKNNLKKYHFERHGRIKGLGYYQRIICNTLRKNKIYLSMFVMNVKVIIEKYGLIKFLK